MQSQIAQRKAYITRYFKFSYNNKLLLWTTKLIWLRAYHLLDAMKHVVMDLVLLLYSQKIDSLFLSAKCGDIAIYTKQASTLTAGPLARWPAGPTDLFTFFGQSGQWP